MQAETLPQFVIEPGTVALPALRPLAITVLCGPELYPALAAARDDHPHVDGVGAGDQIGLDVDIQRLVPAGTEFTASRISGGVLDTFDVPAGYEIDHLQPVTAIGTDVDQVIVDHNADPVIEAGAGENKLVDLVDVLDGEGSAAVIDRAIAAPNVVTLGTQGQVG